MLECINKECIENKNGKCGNIKCFQRKNKTPSYAAEQLNHAIEKEYECFNIKCNRCNENQCTATNVYKVCANRESKPINYEEEYQKLKKDNEETIKIQKVIIEGLKEEKGKILSAGDTKIKELENVIDCLKLKAAVTEKLEIEINNLNAIIDGKDDKISELEKEVIDYKETRDYLNKANECLENELKEKNNYIHDLQVSHNIIEQENNQQKFNIEQLGQMVDEGEEEIKQLKTRIENRQVAIKSLSEGKQKLNEAIEIKDNIIDETMKQNEKLKATIKVLASLL